MVLILWFTVVLLVCFAVGCVGFWLLVVWIVSLLVAVCYCLCGFVTCCLLDRLVWLLLGYC